MATTQDLINAHNGVAFGVTGPDEGQCTAVAHAWEQMTGNPIVYGNAVDTYNNAGPEYDKVANTPDNVVRDGAIVVWNSNWGGGAGHTAVALPGANSNTFQCFEQNDGDGGLPHVGEHNYQDVVGWFIPKNYETNTGDDVADAQLQSDNAILTAQLNSIADLLGLPHDNVQQIYDTIPQLKQEASDGEVFHAQLNSVADLLSLPHDQVQQVYDKITALTNAPQTAPVEAPAEAPAEAVVTPAPVVAQPTNQGTTNVTNIHPKVTAAFVGGIITSALLAALAAAGVHLPTGTSDVVTTVIATLCGYFVSSN